MKAAHLRTFWPQRDSLCSSTMHFFGEVDSDDDLFSLEGMQAADLRLRDHYDRAGQPGAYEGRFYPGPHKFDLAMQLDAFNWLKQNL
jgi:hypothetical protein